MNNPALSPSQRQCIEAAIERLIDLLDVADGDCDLDDGADTEDDADTERNGDEDDFSGLPEDLPAGIWTGEGIYDALSMIDANSAARAKTRQCLQASPRSHLLRFRRW